MTKPAIQKWLSENQSDFVGDLRFDEPLSKHTYYHIGGKASVLAVPESLSDLRVLQRAIDETQCPFAIIGAGSNTLVSDKGFEGLVIKHKKLNTEAELLDGSRLRVGASVALSSLLRMASQNGWGGLNFLTGIPGTVGGAVFMNAGTHLGESKDALIAVEYYPLVPANPAELVRLEGNDLKYSYRKNHYVPADAVIWAAEWRVTETTPKEVQEAIDETLARRKETQPIEFPSCGSVFKNPKSAGIHAWEVIDKLGLRGHKIGKAQFSEKHCNFILNHRGAKAKDVKALIDLAKQRAKDELGIELEEEVRYLGF